MGKLLYLLFTKGYLGGIYLASLWNEKAAAWVAGRKSFPSLPPTNNKTVWMHCASLGEFEQGRPVLEALRKQYPQTRIVLSFFSPSGYEVVQQQAAAGKNNLSFADHVFYLPMDSAVNAGKMIDAIAPDLVLWVKYEFWYHYLISFKKRNIPVIMISGLFRADQPFFKWYGGIWREMLQSFQFLFVQNDESKALLSTVGVKENVAVGGDTRFDRVIEIASRFTPLPLIETFCGMDKVIVAGSTWEEDEEELVHYVKNNPKIKFIIAPHEIHTGNIRDVQKRFPGSIRYSELTANNQRPTINDQPSAINGQRPAPHVLIIDNIGMLSRLYHYAHITFIGGGFEASGIHNVLEPAVYGKPVIFGPEYEKFAEAVELVECGAGVPINNALELEKLLDELWRNEKLLQEKSVMAQNYVFSKAGATTMLLDYIQANRLLTS